MSEEKQKQQAPRRPGHGPGHGIGAKGEKPKNFWKTTKRLFGYMSKRLVAIGVFVFLHSCQILLS